jgi:Na+/H+-dicarboxylate symporter
LPQTWLRPILRSSPGTRLTVAFVLGALAGLALGPRAAVLRPLGDLFVRLLQTLVLPIVVATIVAGLSAVAPRAMSRLGARTLVWYLTTALAATAVGIAAAAVARAGAGLHPPGAGRAAPPAGGTVGGILTGVVPANVVAAMAQGDLLAVVFFAIVFALALAQLRHSQHAAAADAVRAFFDAVAQAAFVMLGWVMWYAPVGTFALVAVTFGQRDAGVLAQFARLLAAVYVGQALVCAGCVLLLLARGVPPAAFLRGAREALITAFVTGSSSATFPVELEAAEHRLRIDRGVFSFALPLGLGISKLGTAVHLAAVSVFAANVAGLALSPARVALLTTLAFLASIGTPPISGGAALMFGFIFTQAALPMELIAVVLGVPFLGKLNTPINSLGRLVVTAMVDARHPPAAAEYVIRNT